jgi:putative sulfotransferase
LLDEGTVCNHAPHLAKERTTMSDPQTPLFILSTGRCGSTMLSRMLSLHPEVASMSEFFTAMLPDGFARPAFDGATLWGTIRTPRPIHRIWLRLLERGVVIDEFRYPLSRLNRHRALGIPPLLCMTLPELSDDPDALHAELGKYLGSLPESGLGPQYSRIFVWLAERAGKRLWVERSGGSLGFLSVLMQHFPDAKYVHIWREGRETALSMSKFHPLRLSMISADIRQIVGKTVADEIHARDLPKLPKPYRPLVANGFDVDAYLRLSLPLERFAELWSRFLCQSLPLLAQVPPERVLHMRYESVLDKPAEELHRFIEFLDPGLERDAWVKKAVALVRPNPPQRKRLPPNERARLDEALSPGEKALAKLGLR